MSVPPFAKGGRGESEVRWEATQGSRRTYMAATPLSSFRSSTTFFANCARATNMVAAATVSRTFTLRWWRERGKVTRFSSWCTHLTTCYYGSTHSLLCWVCTVLSCFYALGMTCAECLQQTGGCGLPCSASFAPANVLASSYRVET